MNQTNVRDDNGDSYIPASQRPDGTWRKARRVKEGYVPQEEVPLYESKGKQFLNRQVRTVESLPAGTVAHSTIPGLFIVEEKEKVKTKQKKKQTKKVDGIANRVDQLKITEPPNPKAKSASESARTVRPEPPPLGRPNVPPQEAADPAKKLKNLKKRLREVETLEEKAKNGEITKPDPDQLKKIERKPDLLMQIRELEKKL